MMVARNFTRKKTIVLAKGAYHGAAPWCTPLKNGTTPSDRANQIFYIYNDVESLEAAVKEAGDDLAAMLLGETFGLGPVGEGHRLDLATLQHVQLAADLAGEIDMKPGKLAGLIDKVERRKIDGCQESDSGNGRKIRLLQALARIEHQGKRRCIGLLCPDRLKAAGKQDDGGGKKTT